MRKNLLFGLFYLLFFAFNSFAQPANDDCNNASIIPISNGGLGFGTFTSAYSDLTNATTQTGETFAPSIFIAGQNQKSVWYRFSINSRRKVRISLRQQYNNIVAGDVGFAIYGSGGCLPNNTNLSTHLSPLETFGNTFHPCVDSGTYYIQVSARNAANAPIYLELDIESTNGIYDNMANAYEFGTLNQPRSSVSYNIDCHSMEANETNCSSLLGTGSNLKSSWHTFTTPAYLDYLNIALSGNSVFTNASENHVIGYRIYQGNARTGTFASLTPIINCDTFVTNGMNVSVKRFLCGTILPNTTYSLQLIYKPNFTGNIKLGLFKNGSQATAGPIPANLPASNQLGTLPNFTRFITDNLGCNSLHINNNCGPTKPVGGVTYNNQNYDLSTYFTFNITNTSNVNIITTTPPPVCGTRLVRVFNTGLSSNCNDLTMGDLYDQFINNKQLICIPPGQYTIQVLASSVNNPVANNEITNATNATCIQGALGNRIELYITKTEVTQSQFRLHQLNAFNNINAGNPLTANSVFSSISDAFGCETTVLPSNSACNTNNQFDRAKYRQFNVADSGIITISSLPTNFNFNGQNNPHNYQLFRGNANALANAQNAWTANQSISGLAAYSGCITQTNNFSSCIIPGDYSFVEYGNQNFVGSTSQPTFTFKQVGGQFSNYLSPNNLGDIVSITGPTGGDVTGTIDTFTCANNAITLDTVPPCTGYTKAIYREFYVSDSVFLRIRSHNTSQLLQLFEGRLSTSGPSNIDVLWPCFSDRRSVNCEFIVPGWYTLVSYGMGPTYGVNNFSGTNHVGTTNNVTITVEFDCEGPKYNKPYTAAYDSITNAPFLITWNQAADTGAYPNTGSLYTLPIERFNCTIDTPFVYTTGCNNVTRVAYYVFQITQESYLNIKKDGSFFSQVYSGNIRQDSIPFINRTPLANCNNSLEHLEICKIQPGLYTLVIYANNRCIDVTPSIYIDKVGTSRFDFARNAYDFDTITPNNTYQWGKIGDVNPLNATRTPSNDFFYCTTGAFGSDPNNNACRTNINNSIYFQPDSNNVQGFPQSNQVLSRRNLWYTFVAHKPGTYTLKVDSKTPSKSLQLPYSIYKSDVNGSLPFAQVVSGGLVDSSINQGLTYITNNLINNNCNNLSNEVSFNVSSCDLDSNIRFYVLVQNVNNTGIIYAQPPSYQVEVAVKLDTTIIVTSANDYYMTASDMGILVGGSNTGANSNYACATRNSSYPTALPTCGQRTLWYKFSIPTGLNAEARIRLQLDSSNYIYGANDFVLYQEITANDSTANGLANVNLSNITNYRKACVGTGTYYLVLTGCNRNSENVHPEIVIDTLFGDYCSNAAPLYVNGAGTFTSTLNVDCHTIGTDYGEFNQTLTCPVNGITQEYKSSWFRIEVQNQDTVDMRISLTENLNANANQVFYRMMTGDCNAMTEQSCIQDILTQNTYLCMMPNTSYYIQVFTPVSFAPNSPTLGTMTLNVTSTIHVDTCAPTNHCKPVANFTATRDCDSIHTENYSTYGNVIDYLWDFGDNNGTYTGINPSHAFPKIPRDTTYIISLRVINTSCNDTSWSYQNMFVPATPNPFLGNDTNICIATDTILLDVTFTGASYVWSTGDTTGSVRVGAFGTNNYHVTITYNNCTYSDTITVFKTQLVSLGLDTLRLCQINDTVIANADRNLLGLTYNWSNGDTTSSTQITAPGLYTVTISDGFCSVTDSFNTIIGFDSSFVSNTICFNELPYQWQNQTINNFGNNVAQHIFINQFGCDSIVFLTLIQRPSDTTNIQDTVCSSSLPYVFYNTNINTSGTYSHNLVNSFGCDSVIKLHLVVNPSYAINLPVTICQGDSLTYNGNVYTTAGNYINNFTTISGCDSVVTVQLNVTPYLIRTQYDTICHNESYTLPSNIVVSNPGIYIDTIVNALTCDSIITTHLYRRNVNNGVANITICQNQLPFTWNGNAVLAGGNNVSTYTTNDRFGCDSMTTLNLTVNPVDTTIIIDTICSSEAPYVFFNTNINTSGTYFHTLSSSLNCDSIIRLQLQVYPSYRDTFQATICANDSYTYNGTTYTATGYYTHTFNSIHNCDSIRVLNLIVTPIPLTINYDTICHNETFTLPSNIVVSNSGTYYDTLTRTNLCDSIVITHLFKRSTNNGVANITICQNQLPYTWNNISVLAGGSGVATFTTNDRFGCDSTTTLNLTVNPTHLTTLYDTVCSNTLPYVFFNTNITAPGTYSHTLTNSYNCDSIIQLQLTVFTAFSDTTNITICQGESYNFFGLSYFTAGTYTHSFNTNLGCDSNKVLILQVNPASPLPIVTSPLNYCTGDAANPLSAVGVNLLWYTTPTGGTGSTVAPTPTTNIAGRQVYYVSQASNGCEGARDSIEIFVNNKITPDFTVIPDSINCANDTILFIYTGGVANNMTVEWIWNGANYVQNAHPNYYASWNNQGTKNVGVYINNNGCIGDTLYKRVHIYQQLAKPEVTFKPYYCLGDDITINMTSIYPNTAIYHWTYNGATINATTQYEPVVTRPGWNYFTIYIESERGCISEMLNDSFYVSGFPEFDLVANVEEICEQDTVLLKVPNLDNVNYHFGPTYYFPNDLQSTVTGFKSAFIDRPGFIYATATNQYGCTFTDSTYISTFACCDLFVPNAFTPNKDGVNDFFELYASNLQEVNVFSIYNRYGQRVFHTNNQNSKWDGTYNGQLLDGGVYHYYLIYTCSDGTKFTKRGQIHLLY